MDAKELSVGIVDIGDVYDEVVKEVLNHQGIIFKEICNETENREIFPCIVLSRKTAEGLKSAKKHCENEDSIVIVDEEIPLGVVLNAFAGGFKGSQNDLLYPLINQLEVKLLEGIKEKYRLLDLPFVTKWFWPSFSRACCVMTHDIDWLYYSPWHHAVIRNNSILQLLKLAYQSIFHKRNYGNNIPELVSKEKRRKLRSSFFFLVNYGVFHNEFLRILELLEEGDFEIGLHGSYSSYKNADLLKKEKDEMEKLTKKEVKSIRQHELKFLVPFTWRHQEKAGFAYDLSFSNNHKLGFRGGISFPYHPFDCIKERMFSILEIPTSFMDWTVLSWPWDKLLSITSKLEEIVETFNGCLVMNFHNTYQNEETFSKMTRLFSFVLDYVKKRNYWVTTANECHSWWLEREKAMIDIAIYKDLIKGKTSTFPIPLVVEKPNHQKICSILKESTFSINL